MTIIQNLKFLPCHTDNRGQIQMILESCNIGSISLIKSEAGTTRANHTHPTDEHTILITEGQIEYYERVKDFLYKPNKYVLNKGDLYHTFRNFEHTMYFPCYTEFLCFSKLPRNTGNYEKETVRFDYSLRDIYNNWKD